MIIAEKIQQYIQELPVSLQEEALDYIEYLLAKVKSKAVQQEEETWSSLSLASAMNDMENEDSPTYSKADLKVVF